MKPSSIFLIAAVAGSAIAAPLYARALEQFNSFVDVYPHESGVQATRDVDDLFTRAMGRHQLDHRQTVQFLRKAKYFHIEAKRLSDIAAKCQRTPHGRDKWQGISAGHMSTIQELDPLIRQHKDAECSSQITPLHAHIVAHRHKARESKDDARGTIDLAKYDIRHPEN